MEPQILAEMISDLNLSAATGKQMFDSLQKDAGPTAYIFRCLHCAAYRTFVDGIFDVGM